MCPTSPILHPLCQIVTLRGTLQWHVVAQYLFDSFILRGALLAVLLAVASQVTGSMIGLILYFMARARFAPFRWLATAYIWLFRGTPLLLQIYLTDALFNDLTLYHRLETVDFFTNTGYNIILSLIIEVFVALSLNEGAYMAEIVRAGIESIDPGQMEAAKSLGMTYFMAMRRVVLPQAARTIVPPLGNEFNNMMKNTALGSAIGLWELTEAGKAIGDNRSYLLEFLVIAGIWYLLMTTVWTFIQAQIERRLNVSTLEPGGPSKGFFARLIGFGGRPSVAGGIPAEPVVGIPREH
jgi:polar amino acid transport system permease protein